MHSIQDNEVDQLRTTTALLDSEIKFVEQYLHALRDAKNEWPNACVFVMIKCSYSFFS
jgi:hypothetical protein